MKTIIKNCIWMTIVCLCICFSWLCWDIYLKYPVGIIRFENKNVEADFEKAIQNNDYRLISLKLGAGDNVPALTFEQVNQLAPKLGVKEIRVVGCVTPDFVVIERYYQTIITYAEKYNSLLLDEIDNSLSHE